MTNEELRKRCDPVNGHEDGRDGWKCKECDSTIQVTVVAHPVWDAPFPCSGSGRCEYEVVPYCPKCDRKPNFHGSPIQVN